VVTGLNLNGPSRETSCFGFLPILNLTPDPDSYRH
jgi:hypothetical protein